ncbi:unnamed protein product [Paramecium pentaurelia]|uniref:Transmembrane protein n=1 Tax=Paramecium pentaurelia TaxID=43138 RepID=A0A8S1VEV7_9CILI|nr:unnamed protein product [Paramecium pentaurelia]
MEQIQQSISNICFVGYRFITAIIPMCGCLLCIQNKIIKQQYTSLMMNNIKDINKYYFIILNHQIQEVYWLYFEQKDILDMNAIGLDHFKQFYKTAQNKEVFRGIDKYSIQTYF